MRKIHIVLRARPHRAAFFIAVMQAIYAGMSAHPALFGGAPVDMPTFKQELDTLVGLQQQARAKVPGAVAARDVAVQAVAWSAELLRAFVEKLCNASPEQAATIAQSAAMQIAGTPVRAKVPLWVRQGPHPGVVHLFASVDLLVTGRGGRFFNWSYSIDGGATWLVVDSTPGARTTISGLPVLAECAFRVCVTEQLNGRGPWSQVITFLVH